MWHFYSAMDEDTKAIFYRSLEEADYFWIFLSMIFGFASHISRAMRWRYILEPLGYKTKFWHRYHALMIGYGVNLLIPRAGEASRAAMLYRSDKVPFSKSLGTIIAERVFDVVMLGIVFLLAIIVGYEELIEIKNLLTANSTDPAEAGGFPWKLVILGVIGLGMVAGIVLFIKSEKLRNKIKNFVKDIVAGVFAIFKSKNPIAFTFHTFFIWFMYIVFFGVCFYAFDETQTFPIGGILIGFIAGTLGIMFTNGGIGAYPYLVGVVVTFYITDLVGSEKEAEGVGKALGMIIWSSQTLMMIVLALISAIAMPKNYKKESDESLASSAE